MAVDGVGRLRTWIGAGMGHVPAALTRRIGLIVVATTMGVGAMSDAHATATRVEVLDNGLTVVLRESHKAPVVSFQVWYRVGSRNEVSGKTGLSHLLEHMMFQGTPTHGKGEYSRIIARNGGSENAFTSRDYTAYYMNWAPQHLPQSVALEADRMTGLLLDPEEYLRERAVVLEERRMRIDDNPIYATVEQLYATAYLSHPYRQPVIGWMGEVATLTRDDAAAHYRRYYQPNNATVVAVGDFDADTLLAQIRQGMGALPAGEIPTDPAAYEPVQTGERRLLLERDAELPFVMIGYPVPNWRSADADALVVLSRILFDGKRSRFYRRLIYQDRIAVDAAGDYDPLGIDSPLFYFYAQVAPGMSPVRVESTMYAEMERLKAAPPEPRELQRAKNQIEAAYLMGQDSVFYEAMRLGEAVTVGAGIDYVESFPQRVRQVTAADVQRVANTYLRPDRRTVAVMIPRQASAAATGTAP